MVITEKELKKIKQIPGFENIDKYNDLLSEIYEELDQLKNLISMTENDNSMKKINDKNKFKIKELEQKIKRIEMNYNDKLKKFELKYGQNNTYHLLKELIEDRFYISYENRYSSSENYFVNYKALNRKNKKLIKRYLKIAKKEME